MEIYDHKSEKIHNKDCIIDETFGVKFMLTPKIIYYKYTKKYTFKWSGHQMKIKKNPNIPYSWITAHDKIVKACVVLHLFPHHVILNIINQSDKRIALINDDEKLQLISNVRNTLFQQRI